MNVAIVLEHLALALALESDPRRGAQLAGYAEAVCKRDGFEREFTEQTTHTRLESRLRETLTPDELAQLTTQGESLTADDAIALALQDP